jgi:hypothetical protein
VSVEDSIVSTLTGLLIKLLASKYGSAGELFKLDFEPSDVAERVFVELEIERLGKHVCSSCLKRKGRFLSFLGYDCVFCLNLLVSELCFVVVNSFKQREKREVPYSRVTCDETLSAERTSQETHRAF